MSRKVASVPLAALTIVVIAAAILSPRTPQPLSYHYFADHRVARNPELR